VLVIGASLGFARMTAFLGDQLGWGADVARYAIVAGVGALALPLVAGVVRVAQRLGLVLAESALPKAGEGRLDLSVAPRRALVVTLQLAIVLVTGLPILAVTQPILGGFIGPGLFLIVLSVLGVSFWRGATELQGHVRAGAQAIVEALLDQARRGGVIANRSAQGADPADALQRVHDVLPGLGELTPVRIDAASPAVGRSLTELNLRGMTGATVLVITRGEVGLLAPTATEVLQAGDVLALAGSREALESAKHLLDPSRER
jgi:CPA2 family monovalent cation:H+ antiporter-2